MDTMIGALFGFVIWFVVRYGVFGLYTVDQNERAVITSFGRAQRLGDRTILDDPVSESLNKENGSDTIIPRSR
jgi:hypothetical protein